MSEKLEELYNELPARDKMLINALAIGGIDKNELYENYFHEHEKLNHKRQYRKKLGDGNNNSLLNIPSVTLENINIPSLTKNNIINNLTHRINYKEIIDYKRLIINDIYIEEFRKLALSKCINLEFLANEILKTKEKVKELDLEKQIRYEIKIIETLNEIVKGNKDKAAITNIQINNNI